MKPAFFLSLDGAQRDTPDGGEDRLDPQPHANGPWQPGVLHGRLLGGLLMRAVQRDSPEPQLACTRLTVDLFRSAPIAPIALRARRIRDGRRIRVVKAVIEQDGAPIAQATAVLLRLSEQPAQDHLPTPRWAVPPPTEAPPRDPRKPDGATWDSWKVPVDGPPEVLNNTNGLWMRETHHLVDDEDPTPLQRVALAGDLASSSTASTPQGLSFINADYTLYIGRPPVGELIGLEPTGHISGDGVAVGEARLHDALGPFGFVATTGVANPTMGAPRRR